jgi:hypothetical protein
MADAGIETIIYIIVVFFWVIGNVMSKSKKKKRGSAPLPRPGESTAEAELREFLETLAGKPEGTEEIEEAAPAPPPRAVRTQRRPHAPAPPAPVRVVAPARRYQPEPEVPSIDLDAMAREMRDGAPSMASSMSTSLSSMGSLFKTTGLALPSLKYALSTSRPPPAIPVIRQEQLRDPRALRNLVAAKMILGTPRAFDPYEGLSDYKNSL